jgi:hypothetical protein
MSRCKFWFGFGLGIVIGLSMFMAIKGHSSQCAVLTAGMISTTF